MDTTKEPQARPSKAQHVECAKCGETLVRVNATGDPGKDFIEKASRKEHGCWTALPDGADHLRLD
jgi:formylmethanofuran dehydrogenase subunit E